MSILNKYFHLKIYGNLKMSIAVPFVITLFLIFNGTLFVFILLLSALIHELAHITAIKLSKGKIVQIIILPFGASIDIEPSSLSYISEAVVSLSGAVSNLIIFIICFIVQAVFGISTVFSVTAAVNFVLFSINILPVFPLDGGRAMLMILSNYFDPFKAEFAVDIITLIFTLLLIIFGGVLLFITKNNFSLIIISAYLLLIFVVKSIKDNNNTCFNK